MSSRRMVLGALSVAVLLASAPWLAGSAVGPELARSWGLSGTELALLTTTTQAGFIAGTLLLATTNLADRFSPRWIFVLSALFGAASNLGFAYGSSDLLAGGVFRFATGMSLAGVYPVGMKIVASWYRQGLGLGLAVMIAALNLGTAAPYGVRTLGSSWPWQTTVATASGLAALGALLVALVVRDGPNMPRAREFRPTMLLRVFRERRFRLACLGYFGHMWELYTVWTFGGLFLAQTALGDGSYWGFHIIAVGAVGTIAGGLLSRRVGSPTVALWALALSAACCASSGLWMHGPGLLVAIIATVWGMSVIADSAQFSTLAAQTAPREYVGTALTVQNGIGYALTLASIQLLPIAVEHLTWQWAFLILMPGPLAGLVATSRLRRLLAEPVEPRSDLH